MRRKPIPQSLAQADIDFSKPCEVYRNLNTGGYSVRQGGTVRAHIPRVQMQHCVTVINDRLRALFDAHRNRRTVHAWIRGLVLAHAQETLIGDTIRYNPFDMRRFTRIRDGAVVEGADVFLLHTDYRMEAIGVKVPDDAPLGLNLK